jgi:hypothetical protein
VLFKTRRSDVPAPFHPPQDTRRRPTVTRARCVLPRVSRGPDRSRLAPRPPVTPGTDRERCSTSTSATDSQGTCTRPNRSTLEVTRPLARRAARPSEIKSPASNSGHGVVDDTPRASVVELHASHRRGGVTSDTGRSCGIPIEGPSSRVPGHAALSSARRESSLPLTPFLRRFGSHKDRRHRWAHPTPRARQGPRIGALPSAFHRRMPARPPACAVGLERGPATGQPRFRHLGPASDAPSRARPSFEGESARPHRFPGLFTLGRSWPRAVRRFLPLNRSASTTSGPPIPVLGSVVRLAPPAVNPVGPRN